MRAIKRGLRQVLARQLHLPEIPVALARLRDQRFSPRLVIDVGAHRGDFSRLALDLWPDARVICAEPLPEMMPSLALLASKYPGRVELVPRLLGASASEAVPFYVADTGSSVLAEHHCVHPVITCPMTTLDSVVEMLGRQQAPDLIKLDVQGYELEVLKGGLQSLTKAGAVLMEVNLIDIHREVPLVSDVVAWMRERAFVAFDVCGMTRRPLDAALWQIDIIFVPEGSRLRLDRRWQ